MCECVDEKSIYITGNFKSSFGRKQSAEFVAENVRDYANYLADLLQGKGYNVRIYPQNDILLKFEPDDIGDKTKKRKKHTAESEMLNSGQLFVLFTPDITNGMWEEDHVIYWQIQYALNTHKLIIVVLIPDLKFGYDLYFDKNGNLIKGLGLRIIDYILKLRTR